MALMGRAFLGIWHGLQEGVAGEFEHYHTVEHMPERLGIPGFLRGRRYMNWDHPSHVCFTMYEASHAEVFRSPGYLARLNAPTEWTRKIQPRMENFLRGVCETVFTSGGGVAGVASVLRLRGRAGPADCSKTDLRVACLNIGNLPGVSNVHIARHRPEIGSAPTGETQLRTKIQANDNFEFVAIIEALDLNYLQTAASQVREALAGIALEITGSGDYRLTYQLESDGL